ncbi:MAG TPA: glycosyltransferase [Bacteriovoracaceae bacterium]|nr:glycosyltransferase [Bacteriovoracaceae bacterium]
MKILHISSEKTWRGGEQQIAYLIAELKGRGVESVVASRSGSVFHEYCRNLGLPQVALGFKSEFDVLTAYGIKTFAEEQKVDLIHLHTAKGHGLAVVASALGLKVPMALSKRTDFPIKPNWFSRFKYNHPSVKRILCVSRKIKEIIDPDLNDPHRSTVVYSGVDQQKFKFERKNFFHELLSLSPQIKLVGNTSAIADQKDYFTFVRTAKRVCQRRPDVRFLIIGTGPMESEIRAFVKEEQLEEKVLFTGFLVNLPEVLFNLDVFLITSKTEGLGTSILDAHACRVPVVGTDAGGIGEIVISGKTGSLCPVADDGCLSEKVLERLADRELFEAPAFVENFSKAATAEKTFRVYQDILAHAKLEI